MVRKLLIANRGEIACRIMRTARRMGIATVAVYSDADRDALHVETADEAARIGPPPPANSYLSIEAILAAARSTGADAVHPGYGFLSERAEFAEAVIGAGLAFVGPNPEAIAAMGDKLRSKEIARAAGVSVVPGGERAVESAAAAEAEARAIGFPVMLKSAAGGGGKGMRVARAPEEVAEAFALASSEARTAFGDPRVFVESLIQRPRHIEIQVLADRHGTVLHLGERECSVQRRNQKVIEEAPSPFADARMRGAMAEQAVALARRVGYDSAGTVEFIAAPDGRFFFLEMNTRLQVEHGVTELVTGLDLVELMIRVARGERLGLRQRDIRCDGWAIEARLYAEDPRRGFLPSVGRLTRLRLPAEGERGEGTIRVDAGVVEGSEVSIHYDPMVAKVMAHAPDRAASMTALLDALDRVTLDGIWHNAGFLAALVAHPRFAGGDLSVDFIAEAFSEGLPKEPIAAGDLHRLAAVALAVELAKRERLERLPQPAAGPSRWQSDWVVTLNREPVTLVCPGGMAGSPLEIDVILPDSGGRPVPVASRWTPGEPVFDGTIDGEPIAVGLRPSPGGLRLLWRGLDLVARVMTPEVAALAAMMPVRTAANGGRRIHCPMPGRLVSVAVQEGQAVKAGETVAVVEAMKMENVIRATVDGTVRRLAAVPGDILAADALIVELA